MGDPAFHAKSSARRFGGCPQDYVAIHRFADSSKLAGGIADWRHRALLHSTFGIHLAEQFFGDFVTNSEGEEVSVRTVMSVHIVEDLNFIPSPQHWLSELPIRRWMQGADSQEIQAMQRGERGFTDEELDPDPALWALREALEDEVEQEQAERILAKTQRHLQHARDAQDRDQKELNDLTEQHPREQAHHRARRNSEAVYDG